MKKPRPDKLNSCTYRIKTPAHGHSIYVTVGIHEGKPFELFINSKNSEILAWVTTVTLMFTAILRELDDVQFLIDELMLVEDSKGGHFAHERFHKSVTAEIAYILDCLFKNVALRKSERL